MLIALRLTLVVLFIWIMDHVAVADTYESPVAVHVKDGKLHVDHVFKLRPQAELRKLFDAGKLLRKSHARVTPSRPDLTPQLRQQSHKNAWTRIREAVKFFEKFPAITSRNNLSSQDNKQWGVSYQSGMIDGPAILAALGDHNDAVRLFSMATTVSGAFQKKRVKRLVWAAVSILVRTGLTNRDVSELMAELKEASGKVALPAFAMEAAEHGYRPAFDFLIEEIAVKRNPSNWPPSFTFRAFEVLWSQERPETLKLALELVDAYGRLPELKLNNEPLDLKVATFHIKHIVWDAYIYAATFADAADFHRLNIGFVPSNKLIYLARVFENPVGLADHYYGVSRGKPNFVHESWHQNTICELMAARGHTARQELLEQVRSYFGQWYANFEKRAHIAQRYPYFIVEAALSHCSLRAAAVGMYDWAQKSGGLSFPDYIKAAALPARHFVETHNKGGSGSWYALDRLERFSTTQLQRLAEENDFDVGPEVQSFLDRKKIIGTPAFDHLTFDNGKDPQLYLMRQFRPGPQKAASPVWFAMRATFAVRRLKNRALVSISFATVNHAENGLAATISGNLKALSTLTSDHARNIIKDVRVRSGEESVALRFLQTTTNGQHIFEITNKFRQHGQIIDVYFDRRLDIDPVSIPVFTSSMEFEKNYRAKK